MSSFTFDDADVCGGYGFFMKSGVRELYVMDNIDENITNKNANYTKSTSLDIAPNRIQSMYFGGKPYLFIYGKSGVQYVDIENSVVIVKTLELPEFESGTTLE